jgi:RNA polymerase sigma factor (TIGR02999 family)
MLGDMADVTQILNAIDQGDQCAASELLPLIYDELRKLAAEKMAQEQPGQTLQATALVHEAYLRLVDGERRQQWDNRGHFFAAAAEAMRRILVDRARARGCEKRGGNLRRLDIDAVDLVTAAMPDEVLIIDEAIARLAAADPSAARIVELRYFAGLSIADCGAAIGISTASAYRLWEFARAWLHSELIESSGP